MRCHPTHQFPPTCRPLNQRAVSTPASRRAHTGEMMALAEAMSPISPGPGYYEPLVKLGFGKSGNQYEDARPSAWASSRSERMPPEPKESLESNGIVFSQ